MCNHKNGNHFTYRQHCALIKCWKKSVQSKQSSEYTHHLLERKTGGKKIQICGGDGDKTARTQMNRK